MYSSDVLALVYPCDVRGKAKTALESDKNAHLLHRAITRYEPVIGSRDPTPAPETEEGHSLDCIILSLDQEPKDFIDGYRFGTDEHLCDVVLGDRRTAGISRVHYSINVDDEYRIWLFDHSRHGTTVSYNGLKQDWREGKKWMLSASIGRPNPFKDILIETAGLIVRIEFPNHMEHGSDYPIKLMSYLVRRGKAVPKRTRMNLRSNTITAAPTPTHPRSYYFQTPIKAGSYGSVWKVLDLGTADTYAAKIFKLPTQNTDEARSNKRKRDKDLPALLKKIRNECRVMADNPHPNIMELIDYFENPDPILVMPYYQLGDLGDYPTLHEDLCVNAFEQILTGLKHLHERQIIHRDIKPQNLLVKQNPFTIIISDFGLSKFAASGFLATVCGTMRYAAPEILHQHYSTSVDIWSTGIVILELMYSLPFPHSKTYNQPDQWYKLVFSWLDEHCESTDNILVILQEMLQYEARDRLSANACLEKGDSLFKKARKLCPMHGLVKDADQTPLEALQENDNE